MLRFLRVEHLAVIDSLEIEFEPGLNVLTGETGAGKSLLVEAVGLLMGGRASPDLIRTGESQASVQALFETPAGDELIVRREVTAQGRSRAFINDTLVTAAALKDQTASLVELHGQHEHQTLLDPQSHLNLLDEFAGLASARDGVGRAFRAWREVQDTLDALHMDERERAARVDLLTFQVAELERANVRSGEDQELESTRRVLANAEKLQRLSGEAYSALYDSDEAALGRLGLVWRRLAELADVDPLFRPYLESRDAIKSQLEDLAFALRRYGEGVDASPAKLQEIEDRLALLERLKRKYGPTLDAVIAARAALAKQLDALQNREGRRAELEAAASARRGDYLRDARDLSARRRTAAASFAQQLQHLVGELAMPRSRFDMRFDEAGEASWTEQGIDRGECYLSPNVGEDLRPLVRIASGGELSRVMLAIRTLAAGDMPPVDPSRAPGSSRAGPRDDQAQGAPPFDELRASRAGRGTSATRGAGKTLIFDEIDAGIGGRVADVVGTKLRRLGSVFQVLCITHLAQIAARASAHYSIAKSVTRGRTVTSVTRLTREDRVAEIARMIGSREPTTVTRAAARELLDSGEEIAKGKSENAAGAAFAEGFGEPRHSSNEPGERSRAKAKGKSRSA